MLLASCAGNSPITGEFPAQRPVTRSFDVFFDLRPNKRFSKSMMRLASWDAIAPIMTSLKWNYVDFVIMSLCPGGFRTETRVFPSNNTYILQDLES